MTIRACRRSVPIVRSVLVLFALLPQLMPPGMCVCQLPARFTSGLAAVAPAVREAPDDAPATLSPPTERTCKRCGCKSAGPADREPLSDPGPVQAPASTSTPQGPGSPDRDDCPVMTGVSLLVTVLVDQVGVDSSTATRVVLVLASLTPPVRHQDLNADSHFPLSAPRVRVFYLGDIQAATRCGCDQNPSQTVPPLT